MIQHFNYHLKSLHEIYDFSRSKKIWKFSYCIWITKKFLHNIITGEFRISQICVHYNLAEYDKSIYLSESEFLHRKHKNNVLILTCLEIT